MRNAASFAGLFVWYRLLWVRSSGIWHCVILAQHGWLSVWHSKIPLFFLVLFVMCHVQTQNAHIFFKAWHKVAKAKRRRALREWYL